MKSSRFYTADLHLGHSRIIDLCKRPYECVGAMDAALISNINSAVEPHDELWILGDFTLKHTRKAIVDYREAINCQNVHLVLGNHDGAKNAIYEACFSSVSKLASVKSIVQSGIKIYMCHYAMRTWNNIGHGAWQLYGHSHGNLARLQGYRSLDVGVDCWGMSPVSEEYLACIMAGVTPVAGQGDHHEL